MTNVFTKELNKKKNLLRNLECGFDFEIWFSSLSWKALVIVSLKETGLIDADLLQGCSNVIETVKWNYLSPHGNPHLRYNITDYERSMIPYGDNLSLRGCQKTLERLA